MTTILPLCPICHKMYSIEVSPIIIQPCGHGTCSECISHYIDQHDGKTCPTCRADIIDVTPNYDLREMCVEVTTPNWAEKILRIIPAGSIIDFTENLRDMSQLIYYRLRNKYILEDDLNVILNMKNCIMRLVQQKSYEYILRWILALNFEDRVEKILIDHLAKQHDSYKFLKEENAEWLMSMIEL